MENMRIAECIRHLCGSLPVFRQIVDTSALIPATSRELEETGAPKRPCKHQSTLCLSLGPCLRLLWKVEEGEEIDYSGHHFSQRVQGLNQEFGYYLEIVLGFGKTL